MDEIDEVDNTLPYADSIPASSINESDDIELQILESETARSSQTATNEAPVPVILLQTILRSSQFQSIRRYLRLPVSGHWALLIRDEVFELNRTDSWVWYHNFKPRERTEFGIPLLNALVSIPQFGACARLDHCTFEQYEEDRGPWTTAINLGTTKIPQEAIHSAIERKNKNPIFYSFFSSNCQHFIVDLCDYLEVAFTGNGIFIRPHFQDQQHTSYLESVMESTLNEIPAFGGSGAATVRRMWIKSRLVLFLASFLHFALGVIPSLAIVILQWLEDSPGIFGEGILHSCIMVMFMIILICSIAISIWLSLAAMVLTEERQPARLDGKAYNYGTCSTGAFMRRQLLETSSRPIQLIVRFLLWAERLSYWIYLILAYVVNIFVCLGMMWYFLSKRSSLSDESFREGLLALGMLAMVWVYGVWYIGWIWSTQNDFVKRSTRI